MKRSLPAVPSSASGFAAGPWLLAAMIVVAALSRLLPHPPNFSPMIAIALFGGAMFGSRAWAVAVPLLAMLLSDIVLAAVQGGFWFDYLTQTDYLPSVLANYACVALSVLLGFGLRGKASGGRVLGASLGGSTLFFVISNFAVWLTAFHVPYYPACSAGLLPCYVAALPFFQWTLLGTLVYAALLFGGFALLRRRLPALQARTV